jgi:hypoxanthine phosphoribosyltransferase
MKVVTLNNREFERACQRLSLKIMAEGLWPDVIVGIARGGEEVLKCLAGNFLTSSLRHPKRQNSRTMA